MRRLLVAIVAAFVLSVVAAFNVNADAGIDGGTNAYRSSQGLAPLVTTDQFTAIASQRVATISTLPLAYWDAPNAAELIHDFGWWPSNCSAIGENAAYAYNPPADWPVSAWIASEPHRRNMVDANGYGFNVQGSARITVNGATFAVQVFGNCSSPALAAPQPPAKVPATIQASPAPVALPDTSLPTP